MGEGGPSSGRVGEFGPPSSTGFDVNEYDDPEPEELGIGGRWNRLDGEDVLGSDRDA